MSLDTAHSPQQTAVNQGNGAVAQQGGEALGAGAAKLNDNSGIVNTGNLFIAHYHAAGGKETDETKIAGQIAAYLRWLREGTENITLRGIERAGGSPVVLLPLETAYVPLRAKARPRIGEPGASGADRREQEPAAEESGGRDIALNQALGLGKRLAIIGGPGSGKTTVLLHMAWALASSLHAGQAEPACSRLGLESGALPLPILVPLASYARYHRSLPAHTEAEKKHLAHFISHHLISQQADFDLPADFFVRLLRQGRDVILLLDGLDEVANEYERAEVRKSVERLVQGRPNLRVVVTCRTIAYHGRSTLGADFREIAVQALEHEAHIAPMVRQAYACIHPRDAALREERARDLLDGIQRLERERRARLGSKTEALVSSPLMVRLLLIVHFNYRKLPDERAELFDKAVNALLQVDYGLEESDNNDLAAGWEKFYEMARHLAWNMHRQGLDQGREIEEGQLKACLLQEADFAPHLGHFLQQARQRGSVLEERDGGYRFIHLAFQEFLVASYLREVVGAEGRETLLEELASRLEDPWWREPILLLAAYRANKASKAARTLLESLAHAGSTANARFAAAELAATAALEWQGSGKEIRTSCAARIVELLNDGKALTESSPATRARAGDALARLGDPRFDPERYFLPAAEDLGFVRIATDPGYRIGTRRADKARVGEAVGRQVDDDEINDQPTPTPEFFIARYPVTVAQFRAYLADTGGKPGDEKALRDPDSRPVHWVNWHEAQNYCLWLQERLAASPTLAGSEITRLVCEEGWRVGLPSEPEWEKAARGGREGAIFPWGDTFDANLANTSESRIGDICVAGLFPANPYGLYDMAGNIWEWTRSLWRKDWSKPDFTYPYDLDGGAREDVEAGRDISRFVRGGSWDVRRVDARCAVRDWGRPDLRSDGLGFRVVLCSSPVSLNAMKPVIKKSEAPAASTVAAKVVQTAVTFGAVTVQVTKPSASVVQKNIEAGQAALERVKSVLVKPGIKIERHKGKPLYFGCADAPGMLIREVDGVRTIGKFVGGRFRAAKPTSGKPSTKRAAKKA